MERQEQGVAIKYTIGGCGQSNIGCDNDIFNWWVWSIEYSAGTLCESKILAN